MPPISHICRALVPLPPRAPSAPSQVHLHAPRAVCPAPRTAYTVQRVYSVLRSAPARRAPRARRTVSYGVRPFCGGVQVYSINYNLMAGALKNTSVA